VYRKWRTLKTSFRTVSVQVQPVSYKRQPGHKLLSDQCQTLSTILSAQNVNTDTSVAKNKLLIDQCQISRHNLSSYAPMRTKITSNIVIKAESQPANLFQRSYVTSSRESMKLQLLWRYVYSFKFNVHIYKISEDRYNVVKLSLHKFTV